MPIRYAAPGGRAAPNCFDQTEFSKTTEFHRTEASFIRSGQALSEASRCKRRGDAKDWLYGRTGMDLSRWPFRYSRAFLFASNRRRLETSFFPRSTFPGAVVLRRSIKATDKTSDMFFATTQLSFRRSGLGISSKSFSLRSGITIVFIPARNAARDFSLSPPIGNTRPRNVISPVMATSRLHRPFRQRGNQCSRHGDTRRRTIFRDRSRGT